MQRDLGAVEPQEWANRQGSATSKAENEPKAILHSWIWRSLR